MIWCFAGHRRIEFHDRYVIVQFPVVQRSRERKRKKKNGPPYAIHSKREWSVKFAFWRLNGLYITHQTLGNCRSAGTLLRLTDWHVPKGLRASRLTQRLLFLFPFFSGSPFLACWPPPLRVNDTRQHLDRKRVLNPAEGSWFSGEWWWPTWCSWRQEKGNSNEIKIKNRFVK